MQEKYTCTYICRERRRNQERVFRNYLFNGLKAAGAFMFSLRSLWRLKIRILHFPDTYVAHE